MLAWKQAKLPFGVKLAQVLHGCRQLVSRDVGLSPLTSETLTISCQRVMPGTLMGLPVLNRRKVGTTSSHHGLYAQGFTRATMVGTERRETVRWSKSQKAGPSSDCRLTTRLHEVGIASNRVSAMTR